MAHSELDHLAFRFFKLFAQYESTLKEREHFQPGKNGTINVDWDRFANEVVGPNFIVNLGDNSSAAEYILESPPMKQSIGDDGRIVWKEVPNTERSAQILFAHICRMRNNLFHGAKFNGTWFDPDRSTALLECGLMILEHYGKWLQH
ncbi:hypothetical protein LX59_01788 [Azomonas agilis]|uniref:Uncharacterized protein n=1 Tax=Azomonas agilis TaxID=116849 RepID=A0A562IKM8_9GAMM|nr:hypothetical protein LX59_01788 [Azomonas agilis]